MPTYDLYTLPEADVTVSGGVQLDGVTGGNGSHLVGNTITLNSNDWQVITISDDDTDFEDNGGAAQQLANETTIETIDVDGTPNTATFAAGTPVEAEFSITVTDGTTNYTVIAFNVATGSPAFGTIEALAFIGPVGGFPPIGVPLTVISSQEGPSNPAVDHATPPCFARGTLIRTPEGDRPIETLKTGDLVCTHDNGDQPIQWIGRSTYPARGDFAPMEFAAGVIGNDRPLTVSPQHRIWQGGWKPGYLFGQDAVLVPACAFEGQEGVRRLEHGFVTYFHLMFDTHQLIWSEGVLTESFFPGDVMLSCEHAPLRREFDALFGDADLAALAASKTTLAALRVAEARAMLAL